MASVVRIGGFSAFWGDSSLGAEQLVTSDCKIDYMIGDYLAEVTMGILGRGKQRSPRGGMGEGGYVAEFVSDVWIPLMKEIMAKGIKIVTNAGGMNPVACKQAIEKAARDAGLDVPVVAAVIGDDLTARFADFIAKGALQPFAVEGEEEDLEIMKKAPVLSCNAYLGAFPIAEALNKGAQIVITGRCVDSALALGPLIHEFGWDSTQLDLLAAGSLAGHLIECATQSTGGNFTDWELSLANGWDNVGSPIAECRPDGSIVITKPPHTGGLVSKGTVCEQMVYEILDPQNYVLPDVNADFSQVTLEELPAQHGSSRVLVKGARGGTAPELYKASVTIIEGWRIEGLLMIGGRDATKKAEATAKAILAKVNYSLKKKGIEPIRRFNYEMLGSEHSYGPHSTKKDSREVMLRMFARHTNKEALAIFAKEVAPAATSMAPGITGGGSGRPQPIPAIGFRSCLLSRNLVNIEISIGDQAKFRHVSPVQNLARTVPINSSAQCSDTTMPITATTFSSVRVPLISLCHGRSGDKGDVCNIGIICRRKEVYDLIKSQLTADRVKQYLQHLVKGKVVRYELPGSNAFNFVCTQALNGGGLNSMNMDRQGKCYAQMLLDFLIEIPGSRL